VDIDRLKQIIEDDDMSLLDVRDKEAPITSDERLVNSFLEIVEFVDHNDRSPEANNKDLTEYRLYSRLKSICADPAKIEKLKDFDRHNLLQETKAPVSVDDILKDDDLNILGDDATDLFKLRNVPESIDAPDYIARQKPCRDFYKYESLFLQCHADLKDGKRLIKDFTHEQQIERGQYFILKGVLVYVADMAERYKKNTKVNARLKLIYENGTESDLLLRSLSRALYKDGRRVTTHEDKLLANFEGVDDTDQESGYIYILKSLSEDPAITRLDNLYKIGFSTKPVADRIKNAEKDPTYLMAPVKIIETYRCYNLNPQKFEHLVHKFFGEVRLETEIVSSKGFKYSADEWFTVPVELIELAVKLIINGEILHYRYDARLEEIIAGED
jgi:hypothetical protein